MKVYDISKELFSAEVYPGDPKPEYERIMSTDKGDICNLSALSMCAHNGTHADAPFHFISGGKTIDEIPADVFVGEASVVSFNGVMTAKDAEKICGFSKKRILLKGNPNITDKAAEIFAVSNIMLIGVENQTVGASDVHKILLGKGIALLEGLVLNSVEKGDYLLSAAPLKIRGFDGAPCRAVLIKI